MDGEFQYEVLIDNVPEHLLPPGVRTGDSFPVEGVAEVVQAVGSKLRLRVGLNEQRVAVGQTRERAESLIEEAPPMRIPLDADPPPEGDQVGRVGDTSVPQQRAPFKLGPTSR